MATKLSTRTALIRSEYAPGELSQLCDQAIADAQKQIDAIAAMNPKARTFDNVALAMETELADYSDRTSPLVFMGQVSTNEKISAEGSSCEEKVGLFAVNVFTRKDLYAAYKSVKPRNKQEKRLYSETLRSFEKNGLALSDAKLSEVRELKKQLAVLEAQFSKNLNTDSSSADFTQEELSGVSDDFLGRQTKLPNGNYRVTTKQSNFLYMRETVKSEATRKRMTEAVFNRAAKENIPLLEQAIGIRQKLAGLLGYKTWADYRVSDRMAKNSKTIWAFLNGLRSKLKKRYNKDIALLLAAKKKDDPSAKELNLWDVYYYENVLKKSTYSVDQEEVRNYFPADVVVKGMFDVYSTLLGVNFVEVPQAKAQAWHESVKLYEIRDSKTNGLIAYFFADFFPRQGKYGHAAAFPLIAGRKLANGKYSIPVASIVANFTPPSKDKPSLLSHDEVETVFHEFGHIMHQTLTRAPYASLSGSSVSQDFVEAPSQMLENWVWQPEVLAKISGRYDNLSQKLPEDLRKKMIAARDFNKGFFYTRQLYLGMIDMEYATRAGKIDANALHSEVYKTVLGLPEVKNTAYMASFGHLMGGYDAGYYGYLWSEVYAEDMFTQFEGKNILSSKLGGRYRSVILEQGNMKDAAVLLEEFLGRKANNKAFFKRLKI